MAAASGGNELVMGEREERGCREIDRGREREMQQHC